jgi:hypothetical protein
LEGRLSAEDAAVVARAVEQDAELRGSVEWLREFLHLSAATHLAAPSSESRRAIVEYYKGTMRDKRPGLWRTLRGLLTADSGARPSLAGARKTAIDSAPRQLVFSTPAPDDANNIHSRDETLDLAGQVFPLGDEEPYFTVQLERTEEATDQTDRALDLVTTDSTGKFSFPGLWEGQYRLVLTADEYEIIIESLELALK